jgi:hypothetical protein
MKGEQMGIAEQHPTADITPEVCPDWTAISRIFDSFEAPRLEIASEGDVSRVAWIFRGLKSNEYELEPSIERFAKDKWIDWAALELLILEEFRSRAAMHIDVRDLTDDLSWRALMRHHGVPTRLLDFTYSPYVALYFALRERTEREQARPVLIWAIDAEAIVERATAISREADRVDEEETEGRPPKRHAVSSHPGDASTDRDELQRQLEGRRRLANKALSTTRRRRYNYEKRGFVALASPPVENKRSSSQQGVFLLNGAEGLTFKDSLFKMMAGANRKWFRLIQVPAEVLLDVELRLFQVNIHNLSLFPDLEGLGGFIRQKVHLHWAPKSQQ